MANDTEREDLKAFERRLAEVIGCLQPKTRRWRLLLLMTCLCTVVGAVQWVRDPTTSQVPFVHSLFNHLFFTISCMVLSFLFVIGIHRKVVTPQIVVSRVRQVLSDFNMSCDDSGRLILKPSLKTS